MFKHSNFRTAIFVILSLYVTLLTASGVQAQTPTSKGTVRVGTTLANDGPGSIFQIAQDANDGDIITFDPSLHGDISPAYGTIPLQKTSLELTKNLTIIGPVAQDIEFREIFVNGSNVNLTLKNLVFKGAGAGASGVLTIENCIFVEATAFAGLGGKAIITNTLFRVASGNSYGVKAYNLTISKSTFIGGTTAVMAPTGAIQTITNSTFFDQGITFFAASGSNIVIINSTIVTRVNVFGQRVTQDAPTFTVRNSILSTSATQADLSFDGLSLLCSQFEKGMVFDGGGNIQYPISACGKTIPVGDPKLGPLQDNGGPTPTFALRPGSAAIGRGVPSLCFSAALAGRDQRGFALTGAKLPVQQQRCDAGAYQTSAVDASTQPTPASETSKSS